APRIRKGKGRWQTARTARPIATTQVPAHAPSTAQIPKIESATKKPRRSRTGRKECTAAPASAVIEIRTNAVPPISNWRMTSAARPSWRQGASRFTLVETARFDLQATERGNCRAKGDVDAALIPGSSPTRSTTRQKRTHHPTGLVAARIFL